METESEWEAFDAIAAEARQRPARVEKLAYRAPGTISVPALTGAVESARSGGEAGGDQSGAANATSTAQSSLIASLEERLRAAESDAAAEIERLRREGRETAEQTRREVEQQGKAALDRSVRQIGVALESFRREREEYFARVEREVVQLALAIAARILHREALLDPLLLAGAVRVALGQMGETTGVRLRCPAEQMERWRELVASLAPAPEIVDDQAMAAGECVIEARVGTVDLGVRAQLAEIERGFFDLLEQRPGGTGRGLGS
jgi:flagellar assembly protein FliH